MAKAGRPSKYDPKYCERVIELGKQGMSVVEMACAIGVARSTLETEWTKAHPDFSEAFARAREESQAWWERTGREGMLSKSIDAAIFSRSMSARFPHDWREKQLIGSDPDNPLPAGFIIRDVAGGGE
jgi:hypothetical protein